MMTKFKIPRSVLVVIHDPQGQVLLLERADHPGFWQSVTGSLDFEDEPLLAAAQRETAEETGLVAGQWQDLQHQIQYTIYPQWRYRYAEGVTHNTEHWFSLLVPAGAPIQLAPREHLQYQWLAFDQAAAACFSPSNAQAIEWLAKRWRG